MTKRLILFVLLCLACAFTVRAQVAVQGTVRDSVTHERLEMASVTVMRHGKPLSFTKTDAQGHFRLQMKGVEKGDFLSVTYLGYKKCTMPIGSGKDLLVEMPPSEFALKEILVKSGPVTGRADTITYDLSRFADRRDNSLTDVLKKLPGVSIDKSGGISVNGKTISRFTVEGLDLTGGRYNKLNETLKAKDVKSAEVIDHDQPVKALQGKVFSDDVAMNIKLKDGAKNKFMFTLSPTALLRLPLKESTAGGKADALQIGKKRQRMYDVEYDQTGKDLTTSHHLLSSFSLSSQHSEINVPQWFAQPSLGVPIDDNRLRFNNSHDWNLRRVSRNEKGEETRLYAGYLHTTEYQTTSNSAHYYIDGEQPVTTTEEQQLHLSKDRLRMDYNHNLNEEKTYGNHYILAEASLTDGLAMLNSSSTRQTSPNGNAGNVQNVQLLQRVKSPEIHLQHTLNRMFVHDRHSLSLYSNAEFFHSPSQLTVNDSENKLITNLWHTNNYLEWIRNRSFTSTSLTAGFKVEHLNVNGGNTHFSVYATPYHEMRKGDATWRFRLPVAWERYADHARSFVNLSPNVSLNVKKGNRAEWFLYALLSQNSDKLSGFALNEYRRDYRTVMLNDGVISRTTTFATGLNYNFKRPIMEWFWVLSANYNHSWFNIMQDFQIKDGEYRYKAVERKHKNDVFNVRSEMSKGWYSLHLKTRLALEYQEVKGQQLSGERLIDYRSRTFSASPEVIFSPSWCDVSYSSSFSASRLNIGEVSLQTLWNWRQSLSLTKTIGKVDVSVSAVHYHNELQSSPALNTLLTDASVVWRMKKLRLSAELRNLFDRRDYIVTSYSGISSFTGYYHLRPREMFLKAQISL